MSRAKKNQRASTQIVKPTSLGACHALLEQLASTVDEQNDTIATLRQEKERIEAEFALWLQRIFARRSERYLNDPNQLKLDLGDDDNAADAAEGLAQAVEEAGIVVKGHVRRPRQRRDESLPEHLERYEVEVDVPEDVKNCPAHGPRELIGYDTTETMEFIPPKLRVRVTKYPKYACPQAPACGVASPERPIGLVEGNRYDTSVAAEIITAKYSYHVPVYRQQDLFAGSGWTPARSTLLNILTAGAFVLEPLVAYFKRAVLADDVIGTDDTRVTLLVPEAVPQRDPNDPKSQRAYEVLSKAVEEKRPSVNAHMWAYRGITVPLNLFDFTVSWHRDGPQLMLADFEGIVLGDCYSGYEGIALASAGRIRRASCAAHARRKFIEAKTAYPLESAVVLAKFRQLYDMEDQAKALSPEDRQAFRQSVAVPVWAELEEWLDGAAATGALPKSLLAKATGYLRNQWAGLQTYLTDGRVPIDNNAVEQLMKQVALGRKNSYDPCQPAWNHSPLPTDLLPTSRPQPYGSGAWRNGAELCGDATRQGIAKSTGRPRRQPRFPSWVAGLFCVGPGDTGAMPRKSQGLGQSPRALAIVVVANKSRQRAWGDRLISTVDQTLIRGLGTP